MIINNKLDDSDVKKIIAGANAKLNEHSKQDDIIGDHVFRLLEQNCRVLYYPLEEDDVWGFIERIKGQLFVCINTSIPYEKQVFAAAHELYHIWFDGENAQEVVLSSNLEETEASHIDVCELKANRFAAEFLAETKLLEKEMLRYKIDNNEITIKEVLLLCDVFTIPYKTMVRRLHETKAIRHNTLVELLYVTENEIKKRKTILGINAPVKQDYILLDNLIEKSVEVYERGLITFEKLEYLLEFAGISPEDVGIAKSVFTPVTDDEIAEILGGDDD